LAWLILTAGAGMGAEVEKLLNLKTDNSKTNMVITSQTMTFDYKRLIAVFENDVKVVDPRLAIDSDKMTVLFERDNTVKSVTAQGSVVIRQQDKTATCDKAVYLKQSDEIMLMGSAKLIRGKDYVAGNTITFWLNEDKVRCEPGRLVIYPQSNEKPLAGVGGKK
jgi:lipopolysaccharide transport protein LptA